MKRDYDLSRISFRLNQEEQRQLKSMLESESATNELDSPTEFFRILLAREYYRRHRKGKPPAQAWQSAFRIGRPQKA
jgi:hypothetical protein